MSPAGGLRLSASGHGPPASLGAARRGPPLRGKAKSKCCIGELFGIAFKNVKIGGFRKPDPALNFRYCGHVRLVLIPEF